MMSYIWSPSQKSFYWLGDEEAYKALDIWPDDGVEITEEEHAALLNPPNDKIIGTVNGRPAWVDIPPPTDEEKENINRAKASALRTQADREISLLTDATDPDIMGDDVNPDDVVLLKAWKKYCVELSRITDFVNPTWPVMPNA